MPIASHLYQSLVKQHGTKKGRSIYFAMETQAREGKRPAFVKALRTASKEGHLLALRPGKTKNSNVLKNRRFISGLRLRSK